MLGQAARRLLGPAIRPVTRISLPFGRPAPLRTSLITAMGKSCYAVVRGRQPGLYHDWDTARAQVQGFQGNMYKGFKSEAEATKYLADNGVTVPASGLQSITVAPAAAAHRPALKRSIHATAAPRDAAETPADNGKTSEEPAGPGPSSTAAATAALPRRVPPGSTARMQFDGASKRNPGPAALGAVLYDADTGEEVARIKAFMGEDHTNNQAEYAGLIAGMQAALDLGYDRIEAQGDSTLIVNQVQGIWRVKNEGLVPYHALATALRRRFKKFSAKQVPRAQNAVADALGNEAIDEWRAGRAGERWTLERAREAAAQEAPEGREPKRQKRDAE